jgi:hypothetical protein
LLVLNPARFRFFSGKGAWAVYQRSSGRSNFPPPPSSQERLQGWSGRRGNAGGIAAQHSHALPSGDDEAGSSNDRTDIAAETGGDERLTSSLRGSWGGDRATETATSRRRGKSRGTFARTQHLKSDFAA